MHILFWRQKRNIMSDDVVMHNGENKMKTKRIFSYSQIIFLHYLVVSGYFLNKFLINQCNHDPGGFISFILCVCPVL